MGRKCTQVENLNNSLLYKKQLLTTGINKVNSTVTTVSSKGTNYTKVDDLFNTLNDLVNQQFKAWYCKRFYNLGIDQVMRFAGMARQEAKTDKKKYFSYLLKHGIINS